MNDSYMNDNQEKAIDFEFRKTNDKKTGKPRLAESFK